VTTIVIDGLNEEDFRRSIENRLREGRTGAAIERLRALLAPYAGPGRILPERFLTVDTADLTLSGWNALGDAVCRYDRSERSVTGLSIAFGWPGEDVPEPNSEGDLRPHVETSYFTDEAFPFSRCGREDLLEGYSFYGCTWSGDCVATDTAVSLEGIDDLHGTLAKLEARLLASDEPDEEGIRAGSLGACLLSALLVEAVTEQIARDGLPRPLCVMAGSSGVYPYFDAPVAGMPEDARKAAEAQEDLADAHRGVPAHRYGSLLMTGIPRAKKRAALVLEESEDEMADRIAKLRSLNHPAGEDEATRIQPNPAAPASEQPEFVVAAAGDSPLLAKKPVSQAPNFRDMLGPREPEPPVIERPKREPANPPEPAPLTTSGERTAGPGFTLLEPKMQQRLQSLLSAHVPPVVNAPELAPPFYADQPRPSRPNGLVQAEDDHEVIQPDRLAAFHKAAGRLATGSADRWPIGSESRPHLEFEMRGPKLEGEPGSGPSAMKPVDWMKLFGWSMASGLLFGFAVAVGAVVWGHYPFQKQTNVPSDTVRIRLPAPVPAPGLSNN
jgi:hypothetical protein